MESGMIVAWQAFERWMVRCMTAADPKRRDLAPIDVLVLHHVNHRASAKRMADVCFVINVEDIHVISYSLRKLAGAGLVRGEKRGKEVFFSTTPAGRALCDRYKTVRDSCLVPAFSRGDLEADRLAGVAEVLRAQVGAYDQASRSATVSLGHDGEPTT
jgi:predicted MarR family transcription regulator